MFLERAMEVTLRKRNSMLEQVQLNSLFFEFGAEQQVKSPFCLVANNPTIQ